MTIPFHCPWVPSFVRVVTQSVKQTTCHLRHKETMFCHIFPLHVLVSHFCQTCQTVEFIISFFHLFFPRSKAEKVFRPWWDTLEDYLLNSLVLLGECSQTVLVVGRQWSIFIQKERNMQPTIEVLVLSRLLVCSKLFSFSVMKMRRTT